MATLKIEINGKEYEESSSGDGQYDAFVRALRKIYKVTLGRKFPMLTNYAVTIPPGGLSLIHIWGKPYAEPPHQTGISSGDQWSRGSFGCQLGIEHLR